MRILKQYETEINLTAVETYSPNLDDVVLKKLQGIFENSCYKSSLIVKITRIIKRSLWKPAQNLADGSGYVCVIFEAESIIYNPGDIIVDCEIQKMERSGGLICKSEYAAIHIKGHRGFRGVQVGQIIPIKVSGVRYSKNKEKISINATPYYHSKEFTIYFTDLNDVRKEDLEVLDMLMSKYKDERGRFDGLNAKVRDFFLEVFYPFTTKYAKFSKDKQSKMNSVDLIKEVERLQAMRVDKKDDKTVDKKDGKKDDKKVDKTEKSAPMYVIRHPKIDKSASLIYHMDKKILEGDLPKNALLNPKEYHMNVASQNYALILISYLEEHISYLSMINELSTLFESESSRQKHKNIWTMYNSFKS